MCHGHHGRALLTKIMETNAVPGNDVFYVNEKVREVIADLDALINCFLAAGIILDGGVDVHLLYGPDPLVSTLQ